jgi:hypothetical protein
VLVEQLVLPARGGDLRVEGGTLAGSRVIARSTSSAMTLPEPSQIAMTGCSR